MSDKKTNSQSDILKTIKSKWSFDVTALTVFGATITATLVTLLFMDGVFSFYKINLLDVNHSIQPADFLLAIVPVSAVVVIYIIFQTIVNKLLDKFVLKNTEDFLKRRISKLSEVQRKVALYVLQTLFWAALVCVFLYFVFIIIPNFGHDSAKSRKEYASISDSDETIQLLVIRKTGDQIIVKPYNQENKKFLDDFEVVSSIAKYRSFRISSDE